MKELVLKAIYGYFHLLFRVSRLTGDHTIIRIPWKCGLAVLQPLLKEEKTLKKVLADL